MDRNAPGVIGISGDFIQRNTVASCSLVLMISGTGWVRPPCRRHRIVRDHVAVDDGGERQQAGRLGRNRVEHLLGRGQDAGHRCAGQLPDLAHLRCRGARGTGRPRPGIARRRRPIVAGELWRDHAALNSPSAAGLGQQGGGRSRRRPTHRTGSPVAGRHRMRQMLSRTQRNRGQHITQAEAGVETQSLRTGTPVELGQVEESGTGRAGS